MKRLGTVVIRAFLVMILFSGLMFLGGFYIGQMKAAETDIEPGATMITVGEYLVLQYEGVNYVIGAVDSTTGQAQPRYLEYLSFLISQAEDEGIQKAAKAIGFTGPQIVTLREEPPE